MAGATVRSAIRSAWKAAGWLEGLSLDAVLVALAWGIALANESGAGLSPGTAGVLALATWLTYVGDRLLDTRPGQQLPVTQRHALYRRHWAVFATVWLILLPAAVILAARLLPGWQFAGGWILVLVVIFYYCLLQFPVHPAARLFLKRSLVPLIFTAGVAWMAQAWLCPEAIGGSAVLLLGAAGNLLLISEAERPGFADRRSWLSRSLTLVLAGLFLLAAGASPWFPAAALASLSVALSLSALRRYRRRIPPTGVRLLADAVLLLAAGILLAGGL